MTATRHPSYLELDRYQLGVLHEPALAAHVAACEQCRLHLAQVARTPALPAWVEQLDAPPGLTRIRRLPIGPSALFAGVLAAAAALVLFRPATAPTSERGYDTSKGAPSVWVHVQHDGVRSPWDGAPLSPGDQIRLELAPDDFTHVTVFSLGAPGARPTLLFRGGLRPHVRVALDKAWQLDDQPGMERLSVLFARAELSVAAAEKALRERDPDHVRAVELVLTKRVEH
jgi:hypothetical protein